MKKINVSLHYITTFLLLIYAFDVFAQDDSVTDADSLCADSVMPDKVFLELPGFINVGNSDEWDMTGHFIGYCDFYTWQHKRHIGKEMKTHPKMFDPQMPVVWFGMSSLHDGIFGNHSNDFHLKDGKWRKTEFGITIWQFSKSWYKKCLGLTFGMQLYGNYYRLEHGTRALRWSNKVEFRFTDEDFRSNSIDVSGLRIPVLIGYHTPYNIFSIATGFTFGIRRGSFDYSFHGENYQESHEKHLHVNFFSVDWTAIAALGPFTLTYNHSFIPLFKTVNNINAYPSSLSFGVDIWWLHRLIGH